MSETSKDNQVTENASLNQETSSDPKKVSKGTWLKARASYEAGEGTLFEIGQKFDIAFYSIQQKSAKQGWNLRKRKTIERTIEKVSEKLANKMVTEAEAWINETKFRSKRIRSDIDKSRDQFATDQSGSVVMDMLNIKTMAQAEAIVDETARQSLGIADVPVGVDITSGGLSFQEMLLNSLAAARTMAKDNRAELEAQLKGIDINDMAQSTTIKGS